MKIQHLLILISSLGLAVAGFGQNSSQSTKDSIYLNSLAKQYPVGITIENSGGTNRKIERYIVVRDGKAKEFKKVSYSWRAKYYFDLNYSITESIFLRGTTPLEGEVVKNVTVEEKEQPPAKQTNFQRIQKE